MRIERDTKKNKYGSKKHFYFTQFNIKLDIKTEEDKLKIENFCDAV